MKTSSSLSEQAPAIAVIGGGVTGLAAAFRLQRAGRRVRLFEAGERVGGAVGSTRADGWLIEAGPNSFQENSSEIVGLLRDLGLDAERVEANTAAKNRYIVRDGCLLPIPASPPGLIKSRLFTGRTKLQLLTEITFRRRVRTADVSLAEFMRDHFGQEIVDYALNPFVSGIYAGDPARLSARHAFPKLWECEQTHGSLIRGMMAQAKARKARGEPRSKIISFRGGLQTLPDRLAAALDSNSIETGVRVEGLFPGAPWRVVWSRGGDTHTEAFSDVILAVPAASLARLSFGALGERPLAGLESVEYPPVASLFLGFRREQVAHPLDGFGALIPAAEKRSMLGILFSSTLFPDRAPPGHVALTVMVGGSLRPDLAALPMDALTAAVMPDLRTLLGVTGEPVVQHLHFWPRAIPQYQLGYERYLDAMAACEQAHAGITIAGNVRDGISLPSCLSSGLGAAGRVLGRGSNS